MARRPGTWYAAILAAGTLCAQTQVDLRTQSKSIDFSAASVTEPMSAGNSLPATCVASQMYFLLTAPPGANLFACVAANQWTLQSGGTGLPSTSGEGGDVLSTDGTNLFWAAPAGDVKGSAGALTVTGIQGRPVSNAAPSSGQILVWSAGAGDWQPQSVSAAGLTTASQLGDFSLMVSNAVTLTVGQNCSAATPCNFRFGGVAYSISAPAVVVLSGGSGTAYLYLTSAGSLAVGSTLSLSCSAVCTAQTGVTAFPAGSIPLSTITATSGVWNSNGITDYRAFLSAASVAAGSGIAGTVSGATTTLSVDSSVVSLKVSAPATSSAACAAGVWATDGAYYYLCVAQNQWKRAALASW